MKKTIGLTRKFDSLGRICIPKEYRQVFDITQGQVVEILATEEGILIRVPNIEIIRKDE